MVSIKEAEVVTDSYKDMGGKEHVFYSPLFNKDEVEKAEAIVKILRGSSVAEAQELLEKINQYLLMVEIR